MKKMLAYLMICTLVGVLFAGCKSSETKESKKNESTTSDAKKEDTNGKKDGAILVVSFGTSYNDSREKTIGAIEKAITKKFPNYEVRRAFTSQIIIDKLKERDKLEIDNVKSALDKLVKDGVKKLVVQPTHLMDGLEYNDLKKELDSYKDKFDKVVMGEPLLKSDDDISKVIKVITEQTASYNKEDTAIVFMGHGTEHEANAIYAKLQEAITKAGHKNYYIGTVEATPTVDDVLKAVKKAGYKKVVLEPLMVVAGDHANNDMAGDEDDSWKTKFKKNGFEVECVLKGLGEFEGIQNIYVEHTQSAMDSIK